VVAFNDHGCAVGTFAEQVDGLTVRHSRRTLLSRTALERIGLALAGRTGARLAAGLGLPTGRSTLLRLVHALPDPRVGVVEVLGVDDFGLRREGHDRGVGGGIGLGPVVPVVRRSRRHQARTVDHHKQSVGGTVGVIWEYPRHRGALIFDMSDKTAELSPTEWVRNETEQILESGTTESVKVMGMPIVLLTLRGAKSGKLRYTPLMRVEHNGSYAAVASNSGGAEHPSWYHNIKAHPEFTLQDGTEKKDFVAREVEGAERAQWWERAVAAFPRYAEYQTDTTRQIPVFVLEPKN
jgi:deazaflavin-dependent oxidoreductase (nitroreductase family)